MLGDIRNLLSPSDRVLIASWPKDDPTQTFYLRVCFLGLFLVLTLLDQIHWKKYSTEICVQEVDWVQVFLDTVYVKRCKGSRIGQKERLICDEMGWPRSAFGFFYKTLGNVLLGQPNSCKKALS